MKLTGDAARKWIAEHPNSSYTDLSTGTRYGPSQQTEDTQPAPSWLSRVASSISQPFRAGAGIAEEGLYTIQDLINTAKGNYGAVGQRPDSYMFMSPEESKALYEDPVKVGLKAGAGVASYGMGAGAGEGATGLARIVSGAKKAVPAGLVGGFGYSREGQELEDTLKGGALAGVLGGGAQALKELGKLPKSTFKAGQKTTLTRKELLGQDKGSIGRFGGNINKADEAVAAFEAEATKRGLPINTSTQRAEALAEIKNGLVADMAKTASKSTKTTTLKKVTDLIEKNKDIQAMSSGVSPSSARVKDEILAKMAQTAENGVISAEGLNDILRYADDIAGGYGKMTKSTSDAARLLRKIREVLRTELHVVEPALTPSKTVYGLLSDATRPINNQADIALKGVKIAGKEIPVTGEVLNPLIEGGERVTRKAFGGASQLPSLAGRGLAEVGTRLPEGLPIGAITSGILGMPERAPQMETQQEDTSMAMQDLLGTTSTAANDYTFYDALADAAKVFPNASESELMSLASKLYESNSQTTKLDATTRSKLAEAEAGIQLLQALKDKFDEVQTQGLTAQSAGLGLLGGVKGSLASASQTSPQASAYNNTKEAFLSKLSRAAGEKGVLTDQDIKRIRQAIPSFYTSPKAADEQWRLIATIIGGALSGYK